MMRRINALSVLLIGAMFLTGLVAVPVASAQADAPDIAGENGWAVGQTIALDWTWADMPADAKAAMPMILEMLPGFSGLEVGEMDLSLDAAFYAVLTVEEVNADEYVMNAKMAVKLAAAGGLDMSGVMPKVGNYNISDADGLDFIGNIDFEALDIPTEDKEVNLDLAMDFAFILSGTMTLEKDTFAIKNVDLTLKTAAVLSFDAKNLPTITYDTFYDWGSWSATSYVLYNVSYGNYDVDLKASFDANLNIAFEPALNIYEFPMNVGDEWDIDSNVTITGGMKGFFDATGLTQEMEDGLFGEDGLLSESGFTELPIVFDELELGELVVKDGKLEPINTNFNAVVTVTGEESLNVFRLSAETEGETVEYTYSSNLIDIFDPAAILDMGDIGVDLDDLAALGITVDYHEDITPDEASAEIKSIENYQSSVDKKARGISDLPMGAIMAVVVIAAILVICAVAVVLVRRK